MISRQNLLDNFVGKQAICWSAPAVRVRCGVNHFVLSRYLFASSSRRTVRRIFPDGVIGRVSTNSILRGYLYGAVRDLTKFLISSMSDVEPVKPSLRTIKALTT